MRYIFVLLIFFSSVVVAKPTTSSAKLEKQVERRQAVIDEWINPQSDGRIPINIVKSSLPKDSYEIKQKCFVINRLNINSVKESVIPYSFSTELKKAFFVEGILVKQKDNAHYQLSNKQINSKENKSPCLNAIHIERLTTRLQNQLIEKGFITSRVMIPEQNLSQGQLFLTFSVGQIEQIKVNKNNTKQTHAHRANMWTAFPVSASKVLNLRDLEQGLENLRRLPTVSVEMDIAPSDSVNQSRVVVNWQQRKYPFRLNISMDDSGSKSTGKYLGTASIAWDNPLRLNDLFYVSYTRNLTSGSKQTNPKGKVDKGKTHNYVLSYSIPLGYWSLDMGINKYHYDQVIAGLNRNYHYTGDSTNGNISLSRVLYRNAHQKIIASVGAWGKRSKSYIDDVEIEVQHRRVGGWQSSLSYLHYFKLGTLSGVLSYKRGTRAFQAIFAPEELFNEGTGKMKIWTIDLHWQMPFKIKQQKFSWDSRFYGQWNNTPLITQDKLSIGDRYSVRGFSGEKTLLGERGWYMRNNISWHYKDKHQLYLGLDTGYISGPSSTYLLGKSLTGTVLGLKGQLKKYGNWYYDFFVGKPIKQPRGFNADSTVFGFNLSYSL